VGDKTAARKPVFRGRFSRKNRETGRQEEGQDKEQQREKNPHEQKERQQPSPGSAALV